MRFKQLGAFFIACSLASGALADRSDDEFDVYIRGLKVGRLSLAVETETHSYAARLLLRTTGLVAKLAPYRFDATVKGQIRGDQHNPRRYSEKSDTGKRQTDKTIAYFNNVPKVTQSKLRQPHWLDPRRQKGRIDTLTATYQLLRNRSKDDLCRQTLKLFDGARAVDISLSKKTTNGANISCHGLYQRVGGFSKVQLSKGVSFPFTLHYTPTETKTYQLKTMTFKTLRGRASFHRR